MLDVFDVFIVGGTTNSSLVSNKNREAAMRLSIIVLLVASSAVAQTSGPTDARGWLNVGVQAYRSARYADAVEDFRKAVELDPSNVNAHLYLATAEMNLYVPGYELPENRAHAE